MLEVDSSYNTLIEMAFILIVLFIGGLFASKLRQSVIPAYILIGIFGQHFIKSIELIRILSTVGLILLLFFIGMEFSFTTLVRTWKTTFVSGGIDLALNFPIGFLFGIIIGWDTLSSLYLAGIIYISSSAIITKTIIDNRLSANPETETILSILVYEDLFIVLFLGILSGITLSGRVDALSILIVLLKVIGFGVLFLLIFHRFIPHLNSVLNIKSDELFLLLIFGIIMFISVVAAKLGLSEAIGAFMAGLIISETIHRERVEEKLSPFKDLFAAIFFLSFGMTIDYNGMGGVIWLGVILVVVSIASKIISGFITGCIQGLSKRASLGIGIGLIARGEFSIILASTAVAGLFSHEITSKIPTLTAFYVLVTGIFGAIAMKEYPRLSGRLMKK